MSEIRFTGTERVTIELDGTFAPSLALPEGLAFDLVDGRARVSLFAFHVDNLRMRGVPFDTSYAEVLWRIAVRHRGEPAWWVVACDLAARIPALAARLWVRYPVRKVAVEVAENRVASGGLELSIGPTGEPVDVEQRPLLTGEVYRVPWGDDGTGAHRADVHGLVDRAGPPTVGGEVRWATVATVRRGRLHRCGVGMHV